MRTPSKAEGELIQQLNARISWLKLRTKVAADLEDLQQLAKADATPKSFVRLGKVHMTITWRTLVAKWAKSAGLENKFKNVEDYIFPGAGTGQELDEEGSKRIQRDLKLLTAKYPAFADDIDKAKEILDGARKAAKSKKEIDPVRDFKNSTKDTSDRRSLFSSFLPDRLRRSSDTAKKEESGPIGLPFKLSSTPSTDMQAATVEAGKLIILDLELLHNEFLDAGRKIGIARILELQGSADDIEDYAGWLSIYLDRFRSSVFALGNLVAGTAGRTESENHVRTLHALAFFIDEGYYKGYAEYEQTAGPSFQAATRDRETRIPKWTVAQHAAVLDHLNAMTALYRDHVPVIIANILKSIELLGADPTALAGLQSSSLLANAYRDAVDAVDAVRPAAARRRRSMAEGPGGTATKPAATTPEIGQHRRVKSTTPKASAKPAATTTPKKSGQVQRRIKPATTTTGTTPSATGQTRQRARSVISATGAPKRGAVVDLSPQDNLILAQYKLIAPNMEGFLDFLKYSVANAEGAGGIPGFNDKGVAGTIERIRGLKFPQGGGKELLEAIRKLAQEVNGRTVLDFDKARFEADTSRWTGSKYWSVFNALDGMSYAFIYAQHISDAVRPLTSIPSGEAWPDNLSIPIGETYKAGLEALHAKRAEMTATFAATGVQVSQYLEDFRVKFKSGYELEIKKVAMEEFSDWLIEAQELLATAQDALFNEPSETNDPLDNMQQAADHLVSTVSYDWGGKVSVENQEPMSPWEDQALDYTRFMAEAVQSGEELVSSALLLSGGTILDKPLEWLDDYSTLILKRHMEL